VSKQIGQRLEARLFGYLRLVRRFGLITADRCTLQVRLLLSAAPNSCFERVIELALIADRIQG